MKKYFFGIDVGTQGVRVILVDQQGCVLASQSKAFQLDGGFREEQSPDGWWLDCQELIDRIMQNLSPGFDRSSILAASVTSTSGTVIPLDKNNMPLHPAIMYSDSRSADQGKRIQTLALRYITNGYTGFNASSGLSKMLWYIETYPDKVPHIRKWIHASDYIVGKLSGNYNVTDYTNALKSGFDLNSLDWPKYIYDEVGLHKDWMQDVVPSGTIIGKLSQSLMARWAIPAIDIVVGITDGCASQFASGAVDPGDWNTTIGTTLVIKGVTKNQVLDPLGRLYSHRHPEGYWMPGGASNTGADWVSLDFAENLEQLNVEAAPLIPTGLIAWPLKQEGERFPMLAPQARAIVPNDVSTIEHFAANMEGVAFIERLAYEIIEELSGEKVNALYTAGGASNSDLWLQIRASVLQIPIYKCKESSGALGAAIVAASKTYYTSIIQATKEMTSVAKTIQPNNTIKEAYELQYQLFKTRLKELKYI